ncbi:hypothetical protein ACJMK2_027314, partial [Sinanodonta woodiana]
MKDDYIRIWLRNPSTCEFEKTINSDLSMYTMTCKHPRIYILVIHRINVSDHKTTWKCSMASKEGGQCFGVSHPCISKVLTLFRRIPVTTVRLTNDHGLPLYSPVTVENGSRTNFTCDTSPNGSRPSALFRWYKRQDGQISNLTEDHTVSAISNLETRPGESDADVLISNNTLSLSFKKSYQNISVICAAQDETNTGTYVQSLEVPINIVYPPVVTIFPNSPHIKVKEGSQNFRLMCHVNESNPKEYQDGFEWLHNGQVIQDVKSSSYMIETVKRPHDGRYQCKAKNHYGIGSSEAVTINVQYAAKIANLSVTKSDILNENDTATLSCFVDSNPESNITWMKEGHGGHLKTDLYTRQSHLVFNCVQCLNASNYTCEASNGLGSPVKREISLHVNCHPRTDFRSPPVTKVYSKLRGEAALTYTVISYPDPKFQWTFTGNGSEKRALPYSATQKDERRTSTLIFTNLDVKDFGFYSVIATNPFSPAATCVFELIIAEGHENEMRLSLVGIVAIIAVLPVVAIVVFGVKRSLYRNGAASHHGKQSSPSDNGSAKIRPVVAKSVREIEVTGEPECLQLNANENQYLEVY